MNKDTPRWDDPKRCKKIMKQWKKTKDYKLCIEILKGLPND